MIALYIIAMLAVAYYDDHTLGTVRVYVANFIATLIVLLCHIFILKQFQKEIFHNWRVTKKQVWNAGCLFIAAQLFTVPFRYLINYTGTSQFSRLLSELHFSPLAQVLLLLDYNLIGPILEELICRAGFMDAYFKNSRYYLDVFVSAVFFAAVHLVGKSWSWLGFMFYLWSGLAFSMAYRYSKNIYVPIVMHIAWNNLADLWALMS